MNNPSLRISAIIGAILLVPSTAIAVNAQQKSDSVKIAQRAIVETEEFVGDRPPSIAKAGTLNSASDHYFDVLVNGEPLSRLQVNCVTFHELDDVRVLDPASNQPIPHNINYGFETFAVTFNEPVPVGQEVRIVIEGSSVQGKTTGIIVPYRVFGESEALGSIPLGTALVRGASEN